MQFLNATFQTILAWSLQPILWWIELGLRFVAGPITFLIVIRLILWIFRQFSNTPNGQQFNHSEIRTFRSPNDEMVICLTAETLSQKEFSNGQKVNIKFNGNESIAVTIKKKPKQANLDHGQILISKSILKAIEIEEENITRVVVTAVAFGWKTIMLQSFDHPDLNIRLAWLFSFWSFFASTVAGIIISHFHMMIPK